MNSSSKLPSLLRQAEGEILADWLRQQLSSRTIRSNVIRESDLREQSRAFLAALREAMESGNLNDIASSAWAPVRDFLAEISRTRARQGFTATETATFILSLKLPLFARLRQE